MNKTDAFQEQLDNLQLKRKEVDALYIKLENSYKIQKLIPDAYEHGACVQTWVDVSQRASTGALLTRTVNFRVTRGDDSVREIPFEELPEEFVNHLIKEKGITGYLSGDYKKCGRTLLVEKLSKIKGREWAKKKVRKKSDLLEDRISQLRAAISDNNNKMKKEDE
jgi:hypothetical protein